MPAQRQRLLSSMYSSADRSTATRSVHLSRRNKVVQGRHHGREPVRRHSGDRWIGLKLTVLRMRTKNQAKTSYLMKIFIHDTGRKKAK